MGKGKILIVDDEPDFVKLITFDLKKRGYEIVTAGNGEEGLEKIRSEHPQLIVFDIKMPKMEGYTFVRLIKKEPDWASIPLIAMSAYEKLKDVFVLEGIKEYITKSANTDYLYQAIERYLPEQTSSK